MPCAAAMAVERAEQTIGYLLRGLDIARDDRSGKFRRQQRHFRNDDADRTQTAGIHRDVVIDHHAEHVEHGGACHRLRRIEIAGLLRTCAGKIDGRLASLLVHRDAHVDLIALVGLHHKRAVMQPIDDPAHAFGRIVLHVAHIGAHHRKREMPHHLVQFAHAHLVGGDLRLDVVDVLQRIARGIFGAGEQRIELLLAEAAAVDQLEIVDVDAFLFDRGGVRRHRTGRDPADVGVMPARSDPE